MNLPETDKPLTVVVYQKRTNGKTYMAVSEKHVDIINNAAARKPVIPHNYQIIELGMGSSFIKTWMDKYGIKKFEIV